MEAVTSGPNLSIERNGQAPYDKTSPLVGWSDGISGAVRPIPADLTGVVKLAASRTAVVAMKRDGTVVTFSGSSAEPSPEAVTNAKELAFTSYGPAALQENGWVRFWESPTYTYYNPGTSFIHGLEGGYDHLLTLQGPGDVVAWLGANRYGEKNVPAGLNGTAIAVAAGGNHSMAIKQDGSVVAWGRNDRSQCNVPASLTGVRVKAIAGGLAHSLALKEDGTVVAWGDNSQGQTNVPVGLSDVREIHAGDYHSVAVTTAGHAIFWGKRQVLGGDIPSFPAPKVVAMTASGSETFASVETPALDDFGNVAPGSQSHHTFVLRNNGTATVQVTGISFLRSDSGFSLHAQPLPASLVPGGIGIFTVSFASTSTAGKSATVRVRSSDPERPEWDIVLTANGYTGKPSATHLDLTTPEDKPLNIQLAGSDEENDPLFFVLESPPAAGAGSVTINGSTGQAVFTPAKDFSGEASFTYRVTDGGSDSSPATVKVQVTPVNDPPVVTYLPKTITVFALGGAPVPVYFRPPVIRDLEDGEIVPEVTYAGRPFTSGIVLGPESYTATVKGTDSGGATVTRSFTVQVLHRTVPGIQVSSPGMATTRPATFMEWNETGFLNEAPTDLTGIKQIAYGRDHGYALRNDGSLVGWGAADLGQLTVPTTLRDATVTKIACGWDHTVALKSDGKVVAWGRDVAGLNVSSFTGMVDVVAGANFSLGLRANGTVQVAGSEEFVSFPPTNLSNVKAIAGGAYHALALKNDGTVVAWGRSTESQTSVPSNLSGVVAIAAGPYHSLALKSDGSVVTWGRTGDGSPAPTVTGAFSSISAGWYHNLGQRTSAGPLASWGRFAPGGPVLNPGLPGGGVPAEVSAANVAAAGNGRSAAAMLPPPYVIDLGQVPLDAVVSRTITVRPTLYRTLEVNSVGVASGGPGYSVDTTGMQSSLGPTQSTSFKVNFVPQSAGASSALVQILSNDLNEGNVRIEFRAEVIIPGDYQAWATAGGLIGIRQDSEAVNFADGLPNLVKFAFNLDPSQADYRVLAPGTGNSGLPHISLEQSGGQHFLRVEYLRRKSGGVFYHVEHSSSLGAIFQELPVTPEVFPINELWERAIVRQPIDPEAQPKGFVRLRVSFRN